MIGHKLQSEPKPLGSTEIGPQMLLVRLLNLYSLVLVATFILPLIGLLSSHPVVEFCNRLTEPVLAPIRTVILPVADLDFSPLVLLIGLQLLRRALLPKSAVRI